MIRKLCFYVVISAVWIWKIKENLPFENWHNCLQIHYLRMDRFSMLLCLLVECTGVVLLFHSVKTRCYNGIDIWLAWFTQRFLLTTGSYRLLHKVWPGFSQSGMRLFAHYIGNSLKNNLVIVDSLAPVCCSCHLEWIIIPPPPPFNEVERRVYWFHVVRPSVHLSVDRIVSAL